MERILNKGPTVFVEEFVAGEDAATAAGDEGCAKCWQKRG
jgi:hypothetical protein